jgi:hypothetical protein
MFIWLLAVSVLGNMSQSFLQQGDSSDLINTDAEYDLITYNSISLEALQASISSFQPKGEAGPENDYLLYEYITEINEIYKNYYVIPTTNSTSKNSD